MLGGDNGGNEVRSTTPDVEPPVVEALTPPAGMLEDKDGPGKSDAMQGLDDLSGLGDLDPEIVALLRADMGLNPPESTPSITNLSTTGKTDEIDDYAP